MRTPAAIRAELATVPAIASFNLDRAARRIAEDAMVRQLRMRADMEKAGYNLKAYIRALPMPERVEFIRSQIDALGGHPMAALFDLVSRDLRKLFDDDTADLAVDLAEAIRSGLRSEDIRVHGGVR